MSELHYQSLSETCRQLKSGALSSVALTRHMLDRIAAHDSRLSSYVLLLADQAVAQAQALDQAREAGEPLGALHGVPVAIKDLLFTKGIPTASGTTVMKDFVPPYDATVVRRLRDAGAVIIGKTQLTEGAFGAHHPAIDPPKNPWNLDHWPGVSSSGSGVAVAAGLAFAALGSDTGGSIRFPSASCHLVGIKPTYGQVSRYGAFPLAESLDHIGPMTRTVEDAARVLGVIAGQDPDDASTLADPVPNYTAYSCDGLAGTRIGVGWSYVRAGVTPEVIAAVEAACVRFESLGAQICEFTMPESYKVLVDEWGVTTGVECARAHAEYYPEHQAEYGPDLSGLIELGLATPQEHYDRLEQIRDEFRAGLDDVLRSVDMLLAPCMTSLPPTTREMEVTVAQDDARAAFIAFTAPFDYSGHPTITLPAGLSDGGLPTSFQLIGRHLAEPMLIRAGAAHEAELGAQPHPDF